MHYSHRELLYTVLKIAMRYSIIGVANLYPYLVNAQETLICTDPILANTELGQCAAYITLVAPTLANGSPAPYEFTTIRSDGLPLNQAFPLGNTLVTWITQADGQVLTCIQNVVIADNEPPQIEGCPSNGWSCGNFSENDLLLTDNCGEAHISSLLSSLMPDGSTFYTVICSDAVGNTTSCHWQTASKPISVQVNTLPPLLCQYSALIAQATGGSGDYTYIWSDGSTAATLYPSATGIVYSVTTTDSAGCSASASASSVSSEGECTATNFNLTSEGCTVSLANAGCDTPFTSTWIDSYGNSGTGMDYIAAINTSGTVGFNLTFANNCPPPLQIQGYFNCELPCNTLVNDSLYCATPMETLWLCPSFCDLNGYNYAINSVYTSFFGGCTLQIDNNGQCIAYTPLPLTPSGTYAITVTACLTDGSLCQTIILNVEVGCHDNSAPIAHDDTAEVVSSETVAIDVLLNDTDSDGDELNISNYTMPMHGSLIYTSGVFIYTPFAGYAGQDSFTYQVCDAYICAEASVLITITPAQTECNDNLLLCAAPIEPVLICPVFCQLPANQSFYISQVKTTFNCAVKIEGNCVKYTALPLFAGEETLLIIGCTTLGICDTVYATVNVTTDCANGLTDAPALPQHKQHHSAVNTAEVIITNLWWQSNTRQIRARFSSPPSYATTLTIFDKMGQNCFFSTSYDNYSKNEAVWTLPASLPPDSYIACVRTATTQKSIVFVSL